MLNRDLANGKVVTQAKVDVVLSKEARERAKLLEELTKGEQGSDVAQAKTETISAGFRELIRITDEIQRAWDALGGKPGAKVGSLTKIEPGFYQEYADGRIYYRDNYPPLWIHGFIGNKYTELGGVTSWLGWPVLLPSGNVPPNDGEQPFDGDGGGVVSMFEHGAIYYWADTGPIELGHVAVRYKGLYCFKETAGGLEFFPSDEPYLIMGIAAPNMPASPKTQTRTYQDVDKGESREDNIELYRGPPYGFAIPLLLMEHDEGDANKYKSYVEQGVQKGGAALAAAATAIPVVGPAVAGILVAVLSEWGDDFAEFLNKVLGTDDDHLGSVSLVITAKQMVTTVGIARRNLEGIQYHLESPPFRGEGASYKAYFDFEAV